MQSTQPDVAWTFANFLPVDSSHIHTTCCGVRAGGRNSAQRHRGACEHGVNRKFRHVCSSLSQDHLPSWEIFPLVMPQPQWPSPWRLCVEVLGEGLMTCTPSCWWSLEHSDFCQNRSRSCSWQGHDGAGSKGECEECSWEDGTAICPTGVGLHARSCLPGSSGSCHVCLGSTLSWFSPRGWRLWFIFIFCV